MKREHRKISITIAFMVALLLGFRLWPRFLDWLLDKDGMTSSIFRQSRFLRWPTHPATANSTTMRMLSKSDRMRFDGWSQRAEFSGSSLPSVLLFAWATEDIRVKFSNSIYSMSCYAHAHGIDFVLESDMNFAGIKPPANPNLTNHWYADKYMWAWMHAIQPYILSGKYDYIFYVGLDVAINPEHFDWPLWAYDKGHDITIMDQNFMGGAWNLNAVLFRTSRFTLQFLREWFEFRKGFWQQGDNGPYQEMILRTLGREAQENNKTGYNDKCLPLLEVPMMSWLEFQVLYPGKPVFNKIQDYSECFFSELDRMAGVYGYRNSKHIGFSQTYLNTCECGNAMPNCIPLTGCWIFNGPAGHKAVAPWANCFSGPRELWPETQRNCFLFHYNGFKDQLLSAKLGSCPDPSFDWGSSLHNPSLQKSLQENARIPSASR
mmetsp:Transcript_25259/g.44852  ORF Transcript_25259/g.44852 Transcript_25259/m.44852 type:complete len:433 (+) Transcript_25259:49-1347(+)